VTPGDLLSGIWGWYLLAKPGTRDEAIDEVIARAEDGEALSVADVQRIVGEATFRYHDKLVAEMNTRAKIAEDAIRAECGLCAQRAVGAFVAQADRGISGTRHTSAFGQHIMVLGFWLGAGDASFRNATGSEFQNF
jgi:hypothetical protein